ncbi:MAG: hypothetical protein Q7S52_05320, partial [bacterium]|nr:hypothetical protein [bacterium]
EVVDGVGYTFKTGSVTDLASKLRFLFTHPALVKRAGLSGKKRVSKEYAWNAIVPATERVYRTALQSRASTRATLRTVVVSR